MRTTINLPDELYRATRVRAAQEGRTVTSVLEEALRRFLADDERVGSYQVRPLRGAAAPAGLAVDDNAAVRDVMDDLDEAS